MRLSLKKTKIIMSCLFVLLCCSPAAADDFCFADAENHFNIDRRILKAISIVESGGNNKALRTMMNGKRTKRVDTGHMQINSWWGFTKEELGDPCFQTMAGAAILSDCFKSYGNGIDALACYNTGKSLNALPLQRKEKAKRYVAKIYKELLR